MSGWTDSQICLPLQSIIQPRSRPRTAEGKKPDLSLISVSDKSEGFDWNDMIRRSHSLVRPVSQTVRCIEPGDTLLKSGYSNELHAALKRTPEIAFASFGGNEKLDFWAREREEAKRVVKCRMVNEHINLKFFLVEKVRKQFVGNEYHECSNKKRGTNHVLVRVLH